MKNLITSIACITILLVFVLQFATNQVTYNHLSSVDKAVNSFKEVCKQEGCIGEVNSKKLTEQLAAILGCGTESVSVTGTTEKQLRGERIHYVIEVPIENLVAASGFWNISSDENRMKYKIDNYTTSEYIDRGVGTT